MKRCLVVFSILFLCVASVAEAGKVVFATKADLNRKLAGYNCSYTGNKTIPNCDLDKIVEDLKAAKRGGELSKVRAPVLTTNVHGNNSQINDERWEEIRDKLEGIGYDIDDYRLHTMTKGFKPKTMNKVTFVVK